MPGVPGAKFRRQSEAVASPRSARAALQLFQPHHRSAGRPFGKPCAARWSSLRSSASANEWGATATSQIGSGRTSTTTCLAGFRHAKATGRLGASSFMSRRDLTEPSSSPLVHSDAQRQRGAREFCNANARSTPARIWLLLRFRSDVTICRLFFSRDDGFPQQWSRLMIASCKFPAPAGSLQMGCVRIYGDRSATKRGSRGSVPLRDRDRRVRSHTNEARAVTLAGGSGWRFRPVVRDRHTISSRDDARWAIGSTICATITSRLRQRRQVVAWATPRHGA